MNFFVSKVILYKTRMLRPVTPLHTPPLQHCTRAVKNYTCLQQQQQRHC